jgi:hypothetical protein
MTAPTAGTARATVPAEAATGDGGLPPATGWRPSFSGLELAFLIAVPLGWAVLLAFHPAPDPDDIYGSLRDDATRFIVVHLGSIAFIALMGEALYLVLRDLPGRAAKISRLAIVPFVAFYAAADAIAGLATGVLVKDANDGADTAGGAQALWDNFITENLLFWLGGTAWIVAAIAAAVAFRQARVRTAVVVLIGLSAIVVFHVPPFGPIGLLCFAAAVVLLARGRRAPARAEVPATASD